MKSKILVSGGFDPVHVGHVRYIKEAAKHGEVIVALNSDEWLMRKKGYVFMPFVERQEILFSIHGVKSIYPVDDSDNTVCEAIRSVKPDYFAKGGDRILTNTPEVSLCNEMGVGLLFDIGGGKIQSSSDLVSRQWGNYEVLYDKDFKVKILTVLPGKSTSLQKHKHRNEHWVFVDTDKYQFVKKESIHQLRNDSDKPIKVVEIQTGDYFGEDDIQRL